MVAVEASRPSVGTAEDDEVLLLKDDSSPVSLAGLAISEVSGESSSQVDTPLLSLTHVKMKRAPKENLGKIFLFPVDLQHSSTTNHRPTF